MDSSLDTSKNPPTDVPPPQCVPQYDEAQSTQPYPAAAYPPLMVDPYPNQPPPSYDVLYSPGKGADTQAVQFVRVVAQQPQRIIIARPPGGEPPSFIVFSVLCVVLTAIFAWPCLGCTLPALIFSILSKDGAARGEWGKASSYGKVACGLNIAALISVIAFIILIVILRSS